MTLEQDGDLVRLTQCPFCHEGLRDVDPARHLAACTEFRAAWGLDAPDPRQEGA